MNKLKKMLRLMLKNEAGSTIVIVAVGMVALIGFVGLVIDGGMLFMEKSRLQKAADAAVLAGAQELPNSPTHAREEAKQTVIENEVPPISDDDVEITENNTEIKVTTTGSVRPTFVRVLGFTEDIEVTASAKVVLYQLQSAAKVVPLGVDKDTFDGLAKGDSITLKVGEPAFKQSNENKGNGSSVTESAGNFGALDFSKVFDCSSGSTGQQQSNATFESDLKTGTELELAIGKCVDTQTGQLTGPVKQALDDEPTPQQMESRREQCPYHTTFPYSGGLPYEYPPNCPLIILVPVYERIDLNATGKQTVKIVEFASFFIENVGSENEGSPITGRFIQVAVPGTGSQPGNSADYEGTFNYKLVE